MGRSGLTVGLKGVLFQDRSPYQKVAVFETDAFGRMLTLDGVIMFTDYDEFVYHEMIAHPALALLGDPQRVLIVGGGDGGAAREVLRHESVRRVDLVDIDAMVVEVSKRFFPKLSASFSDPRLKLHVTDGVTFVKEAERAAYDLVIVDSTDPVGVGEGLFGSDFYEGCVQALTERGILVVQSESPFDRTHQEVPGRVKRSFRALFPVAETYLAFIPTYPMGMWSFTMGSRALHPLGDPCRTLPFADALRYYTPEVHRAAFSLPAFVKRLVG